MNIYLFDPFGILTGPFKLSDFPEVPGFGQHLPGNTIELENPLAQPEAGHVWVLVEGEPQQLADYRGMVYHTDTGAEQEHFELGDLPEGLTAKPWPGQSYVWAGGDWVLDEAAQIAAAQAGERAWRNRELFASDRLVSRHRDQHEEGDVTTLTSEQYVELQTYRRQLRDWPHALDFPDSAERPAPPSWLHPDIPHAA